MNENLENPDLRCNHCNSKNFIKYGIDKGKQKYICKNCGMRFYDNLYEKQLKAKVISKAFELHGNGESFRNISKELKKLYNYDVTYTTIGHWLKKFKLDTNIFELTVDEREKLLFNVRYKFEKYKESWNHNHICYDEFHKSIEKIYGKDKSDWFIWFLYDFEKFEEFFGMGEGNPEWKDLDGAMKEFEKRLKLKTEKTGEKNE